MSLRRALLSVSDKGGLVDFARGLHDLGFELVSSGGTAAALLDAEISVTSVDEVTGFPEILDGRVKTLHPNIHAGLLADRRQASHVDQLAEYMIQPFDLLVSNLYPFRETVARGAGFDEVIENIDVGGPAMVRAAAKNHANVTVVVRIQDYDEVLQVLQSQGGVPDQMRRRLAAAAFAHTAAYDTAVAGWFSLQEGVVESGMPPSVGMALEKIGDLRYGENPHQRAALYGDAAGPGPFGGAEVVQGKAMSFNNWLDLSGAYAAVATLEAPAVVIVKHNNPCGVALGTDLADAYSKAFASDTVSAFGGIVAFNGEADAAAAEAMRDVFTEVVVAPGYTPEALTVFAAREDLRVVRAPLPGDGGLDVRPVPGGALVQDRDRVTESRKDLEVVSSRVPTEDEWRDLMFAWTVAASVKSNAIVLAEGQATVGIGAGQMSRVDAAWIAVRKAGDRARGSVMASDAFFPFPDALEAGIEAGITAVIHPGGSIRDAEVLEVAERSGLAVVTTGFRHFRH